MADNSTLDSSRIPELDFVNVENSADLSMSVFFPVPSDSSASAAALAIAEDSHDPLRAYAHGARPPPPLATGPDSRTTGAEVERFFELPPGAELQFEADCAVLWNAIVPGRLYLTKTHLCFASHARRSPSEHPSDYLFVKTETTKWQRMWTCLSDTTIDMYNTSIDERAYQPQRAIPYEWIVRVDDLPSDSSHPHCFRLICSQSLRASVPTSSSPTEPSAVAAAALPSTSFEIHLAADSAQQRDEWMESISLRALTTRPDDFFKIVISLPSILSINIETLFALSNAVRVNDTKGREYLFSSFASPQERDTLVTWLTSLRSVEAAKETNVSRDDAASEETFHAVFKTQEHLITSYWATLKLSLSSYRPYSCRVYITPTRLCLHASLLSSTRLISIDLTQIESLSPLSSSLFLPTAIKISLKKKEQEEGEEEKEQKREERGEREREGEGEREGGPESVGIEREFILTHMMYRDEALETIASAMAQAKASHTAAPTFTLRSADVGFHQLFPWLPISERPLVTVTCAMLVSDSWKSGYAYISQNFLCFSAENCLLQLPIVAVEEVASGEPPSSLLFLLFFFLRFHHFLLFYFLSFPLSLALSLFLVLSRSRSLAFLLSLSRFLALTLSLSSSLALSRSRSFSLSLSSPFSYISQNFLCFSAENCLLQLPIVAVEEVASGEPPSYFSTKTLRVSDGAYISSTLAYFRSSKIYASFLSALQKRVGELSKEKKGKKFRIVSYPELQPSAGVSLSLSPLIIWKHPSIISFLETFSQPESEVLIDDFGCSLVLSSREAPDNARLYITTRHFFFALSRKKISVPLNKIARFEPDFKNSKITVFTKDQQFFQLSAVSNAKDLHALMERVAQLYAISESSPPSLPSPSSSPSSSSSALSLLSPRATKERSVGPLKITIVTIGSRGDVQPFIALALELKKHGHTPRIATHKPFEEFVTGFGIEFFAIGGDPKDLMDLCVKHDMFSVAFVRQGLSSFKGFIDELFRDTYAACKDWAEAIIATPPSMAGYHVAEALKIPYYVGFTMPFTRTAYYPSPFAVPSSPMPHSYNLATHMMLEQMLWIPIMPQINRFRAEVLNLPPYGVTESTPAFLHTKRVPHLYCFSKYLVPKPPDWSEEINITGFWFLDNSVKDYTPPADLLAFIAAGPCVYIGFGSITIPNPKALSLLVINACKKAKIRAILSKGWGGLGDEVEFPDSFFLVGAVPHDWLFPQMTAVCHHGGAGTTAAALRARKPSVTVSFFGDQYFWGQQITERNVGRTLSFSSITEDALAAALTAVTTDPLIRDAAAFVGAQIAAEKGAECAVAAFHRHLQYAYVPPAYQHSATCHLCRTPFTLLNRRHHCRNCGLSVCNQCSETRMAIPKFYHHTEVRVCDACNARLTSSAEPLHSSNSSVPELLRSAHRRPSGSGSASAASAAAPVALPSSSSEPLLSSAAVAAAGGPSPSTPALSSSSPPGADPLAGVRTAQSAVTHETSRRSGLRLSDQAELVVTSYALRRLWCAETTTNSGLLWQPLDEGEQFVLLEHRTGFKSRPYRVVHKDTRLCVASGTRLRDLRLVLSLFALVADVLRGVDRATLIALSGALEAAFDEPANDDPTELFTATVAAFFLQRAHAKPPRKE